MPPQICPLHPRFVPSTSVPPASLYLEERTRKLGGPHSLEWGLPDSEAGSHSVLPHPPPPPKPYKVRVRGGHSGNIAGVPPWCHHHRTLCVLGEISGTSLFGKRDDHLPSNFTPVFFSQLSGNKSLNGNLTSKCNGDKQCIYDALATGNRSLGLYTGMLFRRYQQMNTTLSKWYEAQGGMCRVREQMR